MIELSLGVDDWMGFKQQPYKLGKHYNMTPIKRYNISHATKMELTQLEGTHLDKFELPDLSRRSERKRIKIPQSTCKKKLPGCFSITDDDISPRSKLSTKKELNSTLDITFRKVQSEQVSPRTLAKPNQK